LPIGDVRAALDAGAPSTLADALRVTYATYARSAGKSRYGDKTPIVVSHLDAVAALLPESRFVHVVRDGRDVAPALRDASFGTRSLGRAAIQWARMVESGRSAGERLGPRYCEVRYEDLASNPEPTLRRVCEMLELSFDPAMLDEGHRRERAKSMIERADRPADHQKLLRPPTPNVRSWRTDLDQRDIALIEALTGPTLDVLGYGRSVDHVSLPVRIRVLVSRAHVALALTKRNLQRRVRGR
jgi:hypothetical protein